MMRPFIITLPAAGLLAGAAMAAQPTVGAPLGTDSAGIAAALARESYDVTAIERLPDVIAVTALAEGRRLELALDAGTGTVIGAAEYDEAGATSRTGVPATAVHATLASQGYTVTSYERAADGIAVDATRDGARWELAIDPSSGNVLDVEED